MESGVISSDPIALLHQTASRPWEVVGTGLGGGGVDESQDLFSISKFHALGSSLSRDPTLFKALGISDPQSPSPQNRAHDSIITFSTGLM